MKGNNKLRLTEKFNPCKIKIKNFKYKNRRKLMRNRKKLKKQPKLWFNKSKKPKF